MVKKMVFVLAGFCVLLTMPWLGSAEELARPPKVRHPPKAPAPLADEVKLNAINKVRKEHKLKPVLLLAPPTISLTPRAPTSGDSNYLQVQGEYCTAPGYQTIYLENPTDNLLIYFQTTAGKTYLVDVAVGGAPSWNYNLWLADRLILGGGLTPQEGHLLIPFIAEHYGVMGLSLSPNAKGDESSAHFIGVQVEQQD